MGKITTILFDFDGTMMDTNDIIIQSWQHTFRTLTGKESPVEPLFATFGEPLMITMKKMFPQHDTEKCVDIYRSYQLNCYKELIELFPGVEELIKKLKVSGYKLAVVTSRLRRSTEEGLNKYGLIPYFDFIVTADETKKHKPDPEPILIALEHLGSKPDEALMVGDSNFDIACAQNAGVKAVLVGWALAVEAQQKNSTIRPDYTIQTPAELLELLK